MTGVMQIKPRHENDPQPYPYPDPGGIMYVDSEIVYETQYPTNGADPVFLSYDPAYDDPIDGDECNADFAG